MSKRMAEREKAEFVTIAVLVSTDRWMLASQAAEECGMPWRRVAFALRRLARRGVVEYRVVPYRGKHRTREYTTIYRHKTEPVGTEDGFLARYMNWII